jgi:hypothetical protein
MDTLVKADIFFFITTIAVVVFLVCAVIVTIYLIQILKDIKILSARAKDEGERIFDDIRTVRENIHDQGARAGQFLTTIASLFGIQKRTIRKVHKKTETEL